MTLSQAKPSPHSFKDEAEFQIGELLGVGMTIVVLGIALAFGLQVLGDTKEDMADTACDSAGGFWNTTSQQCETSSTDATVVAGNPAEYNATVSTVTAVAKIPTKLGIVVTVVIAAVVIGVLATYLWARVAGR